MGGFSPHSLMAVVNYLTMPCYEVIAAMYCKRVGDGGVTRK